MLAYPAGRMSPAGWTAALAWLKARAGAVVAADDGPMLVLAADTVVVHGGEVIGQPRDAADAEAIITRLADAVHEVITGLVLLDVDAGGLARGRWLIDRAVVTIGALPSDVVRSYVATGNWRGKAGGYNLREQLEAGWPIVFEGDPTSIMGLPMRRLSPMLKTMLGGGGGVDDWLDRLPDERGRVAGDDEHLHDSAEGVFA